MKPFSPVLPSHPGLPEIVYAKDQPEYLQLPAVQIAYADGTKAAITRWRLSLRERIRVLLSGCI